MSTTLSASPQVAGRDNAAAANPWIYRPWLDLLVGSGGWSAPLLLLAFYVSNSYSRAWTVAFYFLALLFNYPHFLATVYRAYHTQSEFAKYRTFTVHIALLLEAGRTADAYGECQRILARWPGEREFARECGFARRAAGSW